MSSTITKDGLESAISNLQYRNSKLPKTRLIEAIRSFYTAENALETVTQIDSDDLIRMIWENDDNPALIKSKRKNLHSIKAIVNNDLMRLFQEDQNPEGITIGPLNTFVMSDAAKEKLLSSFADSAKSQGNMPLEKVAEVLNVISEFMSEMEHITAGNSKDQVAKVLDLIKGMAAKVGLDETLDIESISGKADSNQNHTNADELPQDAVADKNGRLPGGDTGDGGKDTGTGEKTDTYRKGGESGGVEGELGNNPETGLAEIVAAEADEIEDAEIEEIDEDVELEEVDTDPMEEIDDTELEEIDAEEMEEVDDIDLEETIAAEADEIEDAEIEEIDEDIELEEIDEDIDLSGNQSFFDKLGLPQDNLEQKEFKTDENLLAEQFDGFLGSMERFYNQYLLIPGGKYVIGSNSDTDLPEQQIVLPDFYLGKYPISNALFEVFVERTGYKTTAEKMGYGWVYTGRFRKQEDPKTRARSFIWKATYTKEKVKGAYWYQPAGPGTTLHGKRNHPVVQVSIQDAIAFSAWVGKRLPTEFEWEAAARTAKGYRYPWGDEWIEKACNYEQSAVSDTTPVNRYPEGENNLGIADALGNVLEWTSDQVKPASGKIRNKIFHLAKGGSWISDSSVQLSNRFRYDAGFTANILGFRCVAD